MKRLFLISLILLASCQKVEELVNPNSGNSESQELLDLVNKWRKSGCNCGSTQMPPVGTVVWQAQLESVALKHSQDMEKQNYFSHTGKNGSDPGGRITAAGYKWRTYGENIVKGYPDAKAVVDGWIKSEGHCKNIMNGNFKEMGVGKSGAYWTQVFASPM